MHRPPPVARYLRPSSIGGSTSARTLAPVRLRRLRRLPLAFGWLAKRAIDRPAEDSYLLPALTNADVRRDLARVIRGIDTRDSQRAADLLGGFGKPALVAWSSEDRFFPPKHAHALAGDLGGARLEWIEDSYTFSPEDQPERLAELIAAFVREGVPA